MKGTLKVSIQIRMDSGRQVIEIPPNTQVNLVRSNYLCGPTWESMSNHDRKAVEKGDKMVFYFKGMSVLVATQDVEIPKFWHGKYNW